MQRNANSVLPLYIHTQQSEVATQVSRLAFPLNQFNFQHPHQFNIIQPINIIIDQSINHPFTYDMAYDLLPTRMRLFIFFELSLFFFPRPAALGATDRERGFIL